MKLNKSDRIKYDDCIYNVIAVIWSTMYLQKMDDVYGEYDYMMEDVYKYYKDIEIIKNE